MKYWLLTTEFPPIHGGGISTYCWHTSKMLASKGHEITVFINDYSVKSIKREKPLPNVTLVRFRPEIVQQGKALGDVARLSLEFAHIVEKEMLSFGVPDILETQDYLGVGYYILQKKYLLYPLFEDLKVVLTMHAPSFLYFDYNQVSMYKLQDYWSGIMEKASIRMADLVISPSNYLIKELESRMEFDHDKCTRIFNPYSVELTSNSAVEYIENDLVFFGKLTPQKGCLEMLSYFKVMWDEGFKIPLSVIGGGSHFFYPMQMDMLDYVKKKYSTYIDRGLIKFEGNLPPDKLKKRLEKAHVVITPSIVDNLPYAVLEAMALGKIVLSSDNGGHTEILKHKESGFIFSHSDINSFEKELKRILSLSKEEIKLIGVNAQQAVLNNTNYEIVYQQKDDLLSNFLSQYTPSTEFPFVEPFNKKLTKNQLQSKKGVLSIVIPYYNMGEYIEDTLKSLEKITFQNTEIIVVNDGSDDEFSIKILDKLGKQYPVRILNKRNEGLAITRNFGALNSQGEYLAFLDADDTVSPEYYEMAIKVLKNYTNVSFVGCWAQYFGESTAVWPTFNPEPPYLLAHNMINSSALVYKKEDFVNYGQNDPAMIYGMEDYESVISMVKNGAGGLAFPEVWWQYRIRKDSMAQAFNTNKELYLYRLISKKHSDLFNKYGAELTNLLNHNGPGISFNNPTKSVEYGLNKKIVLMLKKNKLLRTFAKRVYRTINN